MTPSYPPRLADWLLLRLAPGPKQDSIVGDLHEQYQRGRTGAWYWRQTITAILAGIASDLRRHPIEVVHALCTALGAWVLFSSLVISPSWWLFQRLALDLDKVRAWGPLFPWSYLPLDLVGGWIAGRIVVRFHRGQLAAALFLLILSSIATNLPRLFSLSADAWGYPNYRAQLAWQVVSLAVWTLGILMGGLSDPRPSGQGIRLNDVTSTE